MGISIVDVDIQRQSTYALGLDHAVDEGTSEAGHELLGLIVARRLALALAVLLVSLSGLYSEDDQHDLDVVQQREHTS